VKILLWKVSQEMKLAGSPEAAEIRQEPARVGGDIPIY
jgi:hypothetical protein